jgi:hypothetical protein
MACPWRPLFGLWAMSVATSGSSVKGCGVMGMMAKQMPSNGPKGFSSGTGNRLSMPHYGNPDRDCIEREVQRWTT